MFGKFALFFLVTFCATQSLQASSLPIEYSIVDGIVDTIKDIIAKVEQSIADLVNNIPNLIKNLDKKIKEIIDKIDVGGFIGKIKDKLEQILANAGIDISAARKCNDKANVELEELYKQTIASIAACKSEADEKKEEIHKEFVLLEAKSRDLHEEIHAGVKKCFKENGLNPIKLASCMYEHLKDVKPKADALYTQVHATLVTAAQNSAQITINLVKCTNNINKDIILGEKAILDNFRTCVQEVNQ